MEQNVDEVATAFNKLKRAVAKGTSVPYCLRLWSSFIRLRDGNRCVLCDSDKRLSAHHIIRKSFLPQARFQTGNGITLCRTCHAEPHKNFNQRPDLSLPMDSQGGENIEILMALFGALAADAKGSRMMSDEYYYLSDEVLRTFKRFQGIRPDLPFPGSRVEQAFLIWRQTPRGVFNYMLQAFGIALPTDFIQTGSVMLITED